MAIHRLARQTARSCLSPSPSSSRPIILSPKTGAVVQALASRRHKSTTNRTKRALNIPPHPSFLTSPEEDRIIFNPPSSAATVYHTPFKFLPRTDPRRRANLTQLFASSTTITYNGTSSPSTQDTVTAGSEAAADLPPRVQADPDAGHPRHHLRPEDVAEMRRLRAEDPGKWSVLALAKRYECAPWFVMMCCQAAREHRDAERERLERVKTRWGPIRSRAREDRARRKELLFRGEI